MANSVRPAETIVRHHFESFHENSQSCERVAREENTKDELRGLTHLVEVLKREEQVDHKG